MRPKVGRQAATLIFVALSTIGSGINYIAYPTLAHLLPASEYTNITLALSLFTQIGTFLSSLIAITIGLTKLRSDSAQKQIHYLQKSLIQVLMVVGMFILILSPVLMPAFSTPTPYAFPIVLMLLISVPITIISGYLNGKQLMVRLGLVSVITAAFQLVAGVAAASSTKSGVLTMLSMGAVQVISILILMYVFRSVKIPGLNKELFLFASPDKSIRKLLVFTLTTSFGIMLTNLLQVVDLVFVRQAATSDATFYTDTYILSRALFFAGMIFIWPFLGEVNVITPRKNIKIFVKTLLIFVGLTIGLIGIIYLSSDFVFHSMFGRTESYDTLLPTVVLSVIYKLSLLIITLVVLYFTVFLKYTSVWIAVGTYLIIYAFHILLPGSTTFEVVLNLNIAAGITAFLCIFIFIYAHTRGTLTNSSR